VTGEAINSIIGNSDNDPVVVPTPTLSNPDLFGQVIYEITPRITLDPMGTPTIFDGDPITATITIEPTPTISPEPPSPVTICATDITGTGDVSFSLGERTVPSANSFVRYRLNNNTVITDPNTTSAGVTTTQVSALPVNFNGAFGIANITAFTDDITIANPANLLLPVTIQYEFTPQIRGNGALAVCNGTPVTVEYIIQPDPEVNFDYNGTTLIADAQQEVMICDGDDLSLDYTPLGTGFPANTLIQVRYDSYEGDMSNLMLNGGAANAAGTVETFDPTTAASPNISTVALSGDECVTMNLIISSFIDVNMDGDYDLDTDCEGLEYPVAVNIKPTPTLTITETGGTTPIANPLQICEVSSTGSAQVEFDLTSTTLPCDDCVMRYRLIGIPTINDPNVGESYDSDAMGAQVSNSQNAIVNFTSTTPNALYTTTFTDDITIAQSFDLHQPATVTYQFRPIMVCNNVVTCLGDLATVTAVIVPAPKVRFLDANNTAVDLATDGSISRTVCNGDDEELLLRVRTNFTIDVAYDVQSATITPPGSLTNIWTPGTSIPAATAGTNLDVLNPSLITGMSGMVDYTIVPRTTADDCLGEPISFSIIVTEDPDVFVTGSTTENLCSNFAPSFELRSNFVDPSEVLYDVNIISATDVTGALTFDGNPITGTLPIMIPGSIPGDQNRVFNSYYYALISNVFANSTSTTQTIELEVTPSLSTATCGAADPITLTLNIEPLADDIFTSITRNNPFTICSGENSDISISVDDLFLDPTLGSRYTVDVTFTPMAVINANNPGSSDPSFILPAPVTVTFDDNDAANNFTEVVTQTFTNTTGDYASVRYVMTAEIMSPTGTTCSMVIPDPVIPLLFRVAPQPVLTGIPTTICTGETINIESLFEDNMSFMSLSTPSLLPTNISWQVVGGAFPTGITEGSNTTNGTFELTSPAGAASPATPIVLNNTNTSSTTVDFEITSTNQAGCISETIVVSVIVNAMANGNIGPADQMICEDATEFNLLFTATSGAGPYTIRIGNDELGDITFTNFVPDPTNVNSGDNLTFNVADLENAGATIGTPFELRLKRVTDANGCETQSINQDVLLTINEEIDLSGVINSRNICEAGPRNILARQGIEVTGGTTDYTYQWTLLGPGSLDVSDPERPIYDPAGTAAGTTVSLDLMVTDANGICTANKTISLNLLENEIPTDPSPLTVCSENSDVDLTSFNGTVSPNANTVNWYDGDPANGGTIINPATNVDLSTLTNGLWTQVVNGPCAEAIPITLVPSEPNGTITAQQAFSCFDDVNDSFMFDFAYTGTTSDGPFDLMVEVCQGAACTTFPFTNVADLAFITLLDGTHYDLVTTTTTGLTVTLLSVMNPDGCQTTNINNVQTVTIQPEPIVTLGGTSTATVCNGDDAGLSLTNNYTLSENVSYIVTVSGGTNLVLGANPFDSDGGTIMAPAGGATFNIPTPTLVGNVPSGTVTYTITPRTEDGDCDGTPIEVTINVETDPDVFSTGLLIEETLCSGGAPSFELRTNFDPASSVLFDVEIISAGPNVIREPNGGAAIPATPGLIATLNADEFLQAVAPSYFYTLIPDVLTLAPGTTVTESIVYRVTPKKTTAACIGATPIDFTVNILPLASNVLMISQGSGSFCSGESSDITIDVDQFFVSDFGGNHEVEVTIKAVPVTNINNPISTQVSVPAPVTITFNNANANNLTHSISDVFENTYGDFARIDYQLCATVLDENGDAMCQMVINEDSNGDPLIVRVVPNPVLSIDPVTICSGDDLSGLIMITEDPVTNPAATPTITPIAADWEVIGGYPTGITGTAGVTGTTPDISTGFGLGISEVLTNTTNAPITVFYRFTPSNSRPCTGEPVIANVTVEPRPAGNLTLINATACDGEAFQVQFNATAGTGPFTVRLAENSSGAYVLLSDFLTVNDGDILTINQADLGVSASGTFNIRLNRLFDANSCDSQFIGNPSLPVTINDNPVVDILAANRSVCQDGTSPVNIAVTGGSGNFSYAWSPSNLFVDATATPPSTFDATELAAGNYPITVMVSDDDSGCTDMEEINVIVEPTPQVNIIASSNNLCAGEDLTLTFDDIADSGLSFRIIATATDGAGTITPLNLTNVLDNNTITVTEGVDFMGSLNITNITVAFENPPLNCGLAIADINVNVISAPSIDFTYNTPSANLGITCSATAMDIVFGTDAPGVEGVDFVYVVDRVTHETGANINPPGGVAGYGPLTGGVLINGMDNIVNSGITESLVNTTGAPVRVSYRVFTRILGSGCEGNFQFINAIIESEPVVTLDAVGPLCVTDAAVNLTASPVGGTFAGPGVTGSMFDPATAGIGTHTITYTYIDAATSCSGTAEIMIAIGPDITFASVGPFCISAAAINLTATPTGGIFSGSGITDANLGTFDPSTAGAGTHPIDYTYTDPVSNCVGTAQIMIVVNPLPIVTLDPAGPLCTNENEVTLVATPSGGTFSGTGITDVDLGTFDPAIAGVGSWNIFYTFTDANACTNGDDITIVVNEATTVSLTAAGPFCVDDPSINLTATPTGGMFSGSGITSPTLGSFDPMTAGVGTHAISYSLTNTNGCVDVTMTDIFVGSCIEPSITNDDQNDPSILDPCTCIGNGMFSEDVLIISDPGEIWTITSTDLIDPVTMLPFTVGTILSETAVSSGRYTITGYHLDGAGYSLTAESVSHPGIPLTITNTCFYPDPVMDGLTAYCINDDPVTVSGNAGGIDGTGLFRLDGLALTTTEVPANSGTWQATFDPSTLGSNPHALSFTFDAGGVDAIANDLVACATTVTQDFNLSGPQGFLACDSSVNVTLDQMCMATITPQVLLSNDLLNEDLFEVGIFVNGVNIGDQLGTEHVGQTLEVRVFDRCSTSGLFCWGNVNVEDKSPPVLTCDPIVIWCNEDASPTNPNVGYPGVEEFCDSNPTLDFIDAPTDFTCLQSGMYSAKIDRTWTVCDASNNCSTCVQEIFFRRVTPADVTFPPNYDGIDNPAFNCSDPNLCTDPIASCTGIPLLDGRPITSGAGECELSVGDPVDQIITIDAGTYKILRTWTVLNWCNSSDFMQHIQTIKVHDTTPPTITCPQDFSTGTSSETCDGDVLLPVATVTDNCSPLNLVSIKTILGTQEIDGNGGVVNLPLGMHTVTYEATDDSHNTSSCEMVVTVVDDIVPVAVCNQSTTIGLTNIAPTIVLANTFDDGSHDNCSDQLVMEVRRMNALHCPGFDGTDFGPSIPVYCCDVGQTIMVEFRVTDEAGNSNTCMVEALVQDKQKPLLTCPENRTIDCDDDLSIIDGITDDASAGSPAFFVELNGGVGLDDTTFVGYYANVFDNCGANVYIKDEGILNNCNISVDINGNAASYKRIYVAVDPSGNVRSCTQLIDIVNQNPFSASDVTFPDDITVNGCLGESTDPDNTGRPLYADVGCTIIADTLKDHVLSIEDGVCATILRTWKVIDLCTFDSQDSDLNSISEASDDGFIPGFYKDLQIINVIDSEAPMITSACTDVEFDGGFAGCVGTATLVATATDCTPTNNLEWSYRIDADNDGSFDINGNTNDASGNYPVGTHRIEWTVVDACNNKNTCEYLFTILDRTPPQIQCVNGTTSVSTNNPGVIWATDLFVASGTFDHCTDDANLQISFSSTDLMANSVSFDCTELGERDVTVYVTDMAGQQNSCNVKVDVQANGTNACSTVPLSSVSGGISNESGLDVKEVMVNAGYGDPAMTGNDGAYLFSDLPMYSNYTITPERNDNPLNGISTYDLILISQHILGLEILDSPYKRIAADINRSKTITAYDMVELRKLILFINTEFPENTSWRFVDENFIFPDPTNPFESTFPEFYTINNLESSMENINFVAIKTGDVNGSANTNGLQNADTRTDGILNLILEEQTLETGEEYLIDFTAKDFEHLLGYQFTMAFDKDQIEVLDVQPGALPRLSKENFGFQFLTEGMLTTSWADGKPVTIADDDVLFSLKVKALQTSSVSNLFQVNSHYTKAEAYTDRDERFDIGLQFKSAEGIISNPEFALFQNRPNPFKGETVIGFHLPASCAATLSIFDVSGRLVQVINDEYTEGYHEVIIDRTELNTTGVLYYQLDTPTHTATKKMTLID